MARAGTQAATKEAARLNQRGVTQGQAQTKEMEKQRIAFVSTLGLAIGALCFWITLSVIDYGFWGVLHKVFP
jgi:hypothetical protein